MLKISKCKNCGANSFKKISKDLFECDYCGLQIHKQNLKSEECESKENNYYENESAETKSQNDVNKKDKHFTFIKLMLCIFLGQFGVHRFIEGKVASGILYCLTSGLFGIGIVVDIVRIAKELGEMKDEDEE